jgi:hypothetical protein
MFDSLPERLSHAWWLIASGDVAVVRPACAGARDALFSV